MVDVGAVLLDLDDTLIVEEAQARQRLGAGAALLEGVDSDEWQEIVAAGARARWHAAELYPVFKALGIASWEGLWATFEGSHASLAKASAWAPEYRVEVWRSALAQVGADEDLAEVMSQQYVDSQRSGHPLRPGAAHLVRQLAATVPVVVVTNGPPDIQRLKLAQTGLGGLFSGVVISGELGIGKPHPGVLLHALDLVQSSPGRAVMVGDSWERDVEGALSAGVRPIWLSLGRVPPVSDATVTVVPDVAHVLGSLGWDRRD